MWEAVTPAEQELLRQGDLLVDVPFPRRGTYTLTPEELRASTQPGRLAVVLDRCCTVEQKHTVMIGKVSRFSRPAAGSNMEAALVAQPGLGVAYSRYAHLLQPLDPHIPNPPKKVFVIDLTERVSIPFDDEAQMKWLTNHRVARMTALARASLRTRLSLHFSEPAGEDVDELAAMGLGPDGLPG